MAFSDFQQSKAPLSHRICDNLELPEDICRNCGYIEIISKGQVIFHYNGTEADIAQRFT